MQQVPKQPNKKHDLVKGNLVSCNRPSIVLGIPVSKQNSFKSSYTFYSRFTH